ncbi:MAG: PLP-dependent aminotransferase family protein [Halofilum sp. (in: g-proteobacteria)]|nr:PLP-dependent aminotransferase family protein [Halofilum sp. (in: g-proteobacteria)]
MRETLVAAILDGRLPPDTPVPSSRELARQLGVARNTVMFAYQHLVEEGYLLARERSGYFINPEMQPPATCSARDTASTAADDEAVAWGERVRVRPSTQRNIVKRSNWQQFEYPFIYGQVDPDHFPLNAWRECYRQALSVQAVDSLVRDQLDADDQLLVEQIQTRVLPRRGIWVDPDQILVTLGAQNALYLLAALLVGRRTAVGIEEPGYPDARNIFSLRTDDLRPLPVDEHGLVVDAPVRGCDYVFVTPSHQSPTTVTMPLERREALLRMASESDCVLIEDDYESEITYHGAPTPALKSLDHAGRVLYLGSLSKTLDPGLRMGFLVGPPELIREARALRRLMLRHPPANNQHAVALFLSLGHHDALVQRMSRGLPRALGGHGRGPRALPARVLAPALVRRQLLPGRRPRGAGRARAGAAGGRAEHLHRVRRRDLPRAQSAPGVLPPRVLRDRARAHRARCRAAQPPHPRALRLRLAPEAMPNWR